MGAPTNYKILEEVVKFQTESSVCTTVRERSPLKALNSHFHLLSTMYFHKSSQSSQNSPQMLHQIISLNLWTVLTTLGRLVEIYC